ncbi:MAG: RNA polymerase-associated protein rapA, partial [Candidatus Thioglobus sp.]
MKQTNITLSIALAAVFSASTAFAEAEVTGKIVHESAAFTEAGIGIGAATTRTQTADSHGQDIFKQETTAKIYVDGDISNSSYHVELDLMTDGKALNDYDSHDSYTQRDALREAYVDMERGDWSVRAGKQQVVWGTADGMKLLDAINPTDYSEMAQNQMEDSRIPVWMLNVEKGMESGGSVQAIFSQAKASKIAGLNATGDQGHAFIMKGVDTITGKVNGFLNIAPALGLVANAFNGMAAGYTNLMSDFDASTVQGYATAKVPGFFEATGRHVGAGKDGAGANSSNAYDLWAIANEPINLGNGGNDEKTNLSDATVNANWDISNPNSMFEYMGDTTFATFDTFVNMTSEYRKDYPNFVDGNLALKFKNTTQSGVGYSFNYLNGYDTNPIIDLHWEDQTTGVRLTAEESTKTTAQGTVVVKVNGGATAGLQSSVASQTYTTVKVKDSSGNYYGKDARTDEGTGRLAPKLVFVEKLNKIQQIGGSFDTAIETATLGPVVIRGEALYQKGVKSPVIDRNKLGIGNVVEALKMVEGDVFKYVIGADITVLTNMMVSAQFIQEMNLDYIDEAGTCTGTSTGANCGRYTADRSAMHLSNGLQKAEENKEFYSIFLSKPFGASGEHRWNNIL